VVVEPAVEAEIAEEEAARVEAIDVKAVGAGNVVDAAVAQELVEEEPVATDVVARAMTEPEAVESEAVVVEPAVEAEIAEEEATRAETIDVEAVEAEEPGAINDLFVKLGWRPTRSPDDLTAIKGIGKRYCDRLYSAGVYTFAELAATDPEELRQAARVMRTVDIESWRRQAHELAVEFDREDVRYFGPRPNDLTAIKGITPQIMRRLYQRGIVTYTQLARLSERQLAENLAGLGVAESPDLRTWLVKAAELSRARLAPPQGGDQ
jgi:predicted flap endonuclease-1-like 5' DNA nuclease